MSESSEQIDKLASALAKAQGKITGALKDTKNEFFKSKYADLAACWDACRLPLSENGLAVIQTTELGELGVTVVTTLVHETGQWVRGKLRMMPKDQGPQAMGSCITYARRYALAAIVGLAQVDDDANAAERQTEPMAPAVPEKKWTAADTKKAKEHAQRIINGVAEGKDPVELWDECSEDHDFASAVWSNLPAPVKNVIKDERAKQSKAA